MLARRLSMLGLIAIGLSAGAAVRPAAALDIVALTGQPTVTGQYYGDLGLPAINNSGEIAFRAGLKPSANGPVTVQSMWKVGEQAHRLAMNGQQVDGETVSLLGGNPILADTGEAAFRDSGRMMIADEGGAHIVASTNGGSFFAFVDSLGGGVGPVFSNDGTMAFLAQLSGASFSANVGIWSGRPGSLQLVALEGMVLPGTTLPVDRFEREVRIGAADQVTFTARLIDNFPQQGAWVGNGAGLHKLLQSEETIAPGTGRVFDDRSDFAKQMIEVNAHGNLAFQRGLNGPDINSTNDTGVWSGPADDYQLLARTGSPLPDLDYLTHLSNTAPLINANGQLLLRVEFYDQALQQQQGLWLGTNAGDLHSVVRSGDPAPGLEPGAYFGFVQLSSMNAAGEIVFVAQIWGPNGTADNNDSLWGIDRAGHLHLLAREGNSVDVDPTDGIDLRVIKAIDFHSGSGGENGLARSINDAGLTTFALDFTDGSRALVTTPVPEPATLGLAAVGLVLLALGEARRRFGRRPAGQRCPTDR